MNALKLSPFSITYDLFVIWHTRILWRKLCTIRTDNTPFAVHYEKYAINWVRWRPMMRRYDSIRLAHKSDSITIFAF